MTHVFYPEASSGSCTAPLLLDIDLIKFKRGPSASSFALASYVNDRPYAASSFTSVAIARVFSSALNGQCKDRPELVEIAAAAFGAVERTALSRRRRAVARTL